MVYHAPPSAAQYRIAVEASWRFHQPLPVHQNHCILSTVIFRFQYLLVRHASEQVLEARRPIVRQHLVLLSQLREGYAIVAAPLEMHQRHAD
jgi:hypothetical protein